jgi:hypothetical protein
MTCIGLRVAALALVLCGAIPVLRADLRPLAGRNVLGPLASSAAPLATGVVTEDVVWTDKVNTTATGNDLEKTSGGNAWNAGAVSTKAISSGDGYAEYTVTGTGYYALFGLSNGQTDESLADIDFAIYTYPPTGQVFVFEAGANRGVKGTYTTNDVLRVAVESGQVVYRKNGALLYTSAGSPSYPLLIDTSILTVGTVIGDAMISGVLEASGY